MHDLLGIFGGNEDATIAFSADEEAQETAINSVVAVGATAEPASGPITLKALATPISIPFAIPEVIRSSSVLSFKLTIVGWDGSAECTVSAILPWSGIPADVPGDESWQVDPVGWPT